MNVDHVDLSAARLFVAYPRFLAYGNETRRDGAKKKNLPLKFTARIKIEVLISRKSGAKIFSMLRLNIEWIINWRWFTLRWINNEPPNTSSTCRSVRWHFTSANRTPVMTRTRKKGWALTCSILGDDKFYLFSEKDWWVNYPLAAFHSTPQMYDNRFSRCLHFERFFASASPKATQS